MATAEAANDLYLWFELNLKERGTDVSSSILITSRYLKDVAHTDPEMDHFPILKAINGIGSKMGDFLPSETRATIVLDISAHSYQWERRILDLFERRTPVEQEITIYYSAVKPSDGLTSPLSGTVIYKSTVRSWSANFGSEEISIITSDNKIADKSLGYSINPIDYPSAPDKSIGKTLPLTFGAEVETRLYALDDNRDGAQFAGASALGSSYGPGGVQSNDLFVKSPSLGWQRVSSGSDSGSVYSDSYTVDTAYSWVDSAVAPQEKVSMAWPLQTESSSSKGWICTAIELTLHAPPQSTTNGEVMTVRLLAKDDVASAPGTTVFGTATINSDDFTTEISASTNTAYQARFEFDPPAIIPPSYSNSKDRIYLEINTFVEGIESTTTSPDFYWNSHNGTQSVVRFGKDLRAGEDGWTVRATSATGAGNLPRPQYKIFAAGWTNENISTSPVDDTGWAPKLLTFTQDLASGSSGSDLSALDMIGVATGLQDNSSGTITGTPSATLDTVGACLNALTAVYSNSTWTLDSDVDVSTYNSQLQIVSDFGLKIQGRTSGRATLSSTLAELCYSSATRIGATNSGITLYQQGEKVTSSGRIEDSECRIVSLEEKPAAQTVVNKYILNYDQKLTVSNVFDASNQDDLKSFAGYTRLGSGELNDLVIKSEAIYGSRELRSVRFPFVKDDASAREVAIRYARVFGRNPIWIVTFEIPFLRFPSLDIFQVYELVSSRMPAFYGTGSESYVPIYATDAGDVTKQATVDEGKLSEKRARLYRVQIESRSLVFRDSKSPYWRCTARVILDNIDPT